MPSVTTDTKAIDSRSRGAGRGTADSQASSGDQAFGGVLSSLADDPDVIVAGAGKATVTSTIVATNLQTLGAAATKAAASDTKDTGAAITTLVGKIIASGASTSPDGTTKTDKKKAVASESPTDDTTIVQTALISSQVGLSADLAALLAAPVRSAAGPANAVSPAKTSGTAAGSRIAISADSASSASAAQSNRDAGPAIDKVSVQTALAPSTGASNAMALAVTTKDTATEVASASTFAMAGPIQTIADAISDLAATSPASAVTGDVAIPIAGLAPARTMTLQLTPADLGTVAVRLHLTGDTLDVSLSVSEPRTLGLLDRDRDALSTALGNQSYQLNSLVIQGADASASTSGGNNAGQDDKNGTTRGNTGTNDDRGGGDGRRQDQSQSQARPRAVPGGARSVGSGRADHLFV